MVNNFIVWIFAGVVIGWLANQIRPTRQGLSLNIILGVVGACVAGWFLTPLFGISTLNEDYFSLPALLVSLLGAMLLLAVVKFFRRSGVRAA
jgi:uncharacterized membrane protein YeaQ/YmgE (transglycosylase-associated protein family)